MISQTAEYALRAAVFLAGQDGQAMTSRQIAEGTAVPSGYLSKVLQAMVRAGLVKSQRGPHGGFTLGRSVDKVSVLDIITAVDPIRRIRTCPLDRTEHKQQLCPLHRRIDDAAALIERAFRHSTLGDLLIEEANAHGGEETEAGSVSHEVKTPSDVPCSGLCPNRNRCQQEYDHKFGASDSTSDDDLPTPTHRNWLRHYAELHSAALVMARRLSLAADECEEAKRAATIREFVDHWDEEMALHFADEERLLTPLIPEDRLARRLNDEHAALRQCASEARRLLTRNQVPSSRWLREVGSMLHDHITWEERELFPAIERFATTADLDRLSSQAELAEAARSRHIPTP